MKLVDIVRNECIIAGAQLKDKKAAFDLVAGTAKNCTALNEVSKEDILNALKQRESLGSTGFGNGIAIPHCRMKTVTEFVVGVISVPDGVDFDAIDNQKVKLIVFIIAPEKKSNEHIRLLSAISQTLIIPGAVKKLLAAKTSEVVYESFLLLSRSDIETNGESKNSLLHVFVQDEGLFHDIFENIALIGPSSLVVVSAENAVAYLASAPLFAGFWCDETNKFSKVIFAVVDKGLINETIRRIETVTGDLKQRTGVMLTVQDIAYSAGMLNVEG